MALHDKALMMSKLNEAKERATPFVKHVHLMEGRPEEESPDVTFFSLATCYQVTRLRAILV